MTELNYLNLFKQYAKELKVIANDETKNNRFFYVIRAQDPMSGIWERDFEESLRSRIDCKTKYAMILEARQVKGEGDNKVAKAYEAVMCSFIIVKKVAYTGTRYTPADVATTLEGCEGVCRKILGRLQNDLRTLFNAGTTGYYLTLQDGWEFLPVGEIQDGIFGVRCDFSMMLNNSKGYYYNAQEWTITP
jgi:hypothetical protein